jgi:predicted dithiol-disulfide oxidoreductase (DUF899 family)
MASHQLGTREQWAVAYAELRAEEKDLTHRNAALARKRQALPWVPVEKDYRFETDNLVGAAVHLAHRDVTFILASRSPLEVLNAYKVRMGWEIEWVSSEDAFDSDFHEIMHVATPRRPGNMLDVMELMAVSVFALDDGVVYHTYSTYDRGTEALNATWQLLDRAPSGRGENFDGWPRKRDEYVTA